MLLKSVRFWWAVLALASLAILAVMVVRSHRTVAVAPPKPNQQVSAPISAWRPPPPAVPAGSSQVAATGDADPQATGAPLPGTQAPRVPDRSTDPPKRKLTQEEIESGRW